MLERAVSLLICGILDSETTSYSVATNDLSDAALKTQRV